MTKQAVLDAQAEIIALRAVVKVLLRRIYGMGDQVLSNLREEALAGVETALGKTDEDKCQKYFHGAVRDALTDLLTPDEGQMTVLGGNGLADIHGGTTTVGREVSWRELEAYHLRKIGLLPHTRGSLSLTRELDDRCKDQEVLAGAC